jgi:PAS domain S-box-containing protein
MTGYLRILSALLFLFLGIHCPEAYAQLDTEADSLTNLLTRTEDAEKKSDILVALAQLYRGNDPDKSLEYASQALKTSSQEDYQKGRAEALIIIGAVYNRKSRYDLALENAEKAYQITDQYNLPEEKIVALRLKNSVYVALSDFELAAKLLFEALEISEEIDDKKSIAKCFNSIGEIYFVQYNYIKAHEYYSKSMAISREINDKKGIARELNNLANTSWYLGEPDTYEKNIRQAISLNKEMNYQNSLLANYFNLGDMYSEYGQFDSAIIYNQYAFEIAKALGDLRRMSWIKTVMAQLHFRTSGETGLAIKYANEAFAIADSIGSKKEKFLAASVLADFYQFENNPDSILKYTTLKYVLKDSLDIDRENIALNKLELQHELEKVVLENETETKQAYFILAITGTAFLMVLTILLFLYFRHQVKTRDILLNEQKKADEAIRKSEEKFRGVFNSMADVFSRSDMEGKCIMISPSVFPLLGYKPEEIIGRNMADFYAHPEQRFEIVQILKRSRKVENFEIDVIRKGGEIITVSTNAKLYFDDNGQPLGVEGVFRDITQKLEVEKSLRESEAKFRGVFKNMVDVFTRADMNGNCLLISPSVNDILGYTPDEIIGKNYEEFFSKPEDWRILNQKLIDTGAMNDIESEVVRKDGKRIFISSNARVFYDEDGKPAGIESVFRDITEQKRAASEHHKLFNVSFDLLCIAGFDGYFKELNPAWEKATGYTIKELKSMPFIEFLVEGDRLKTQKEFAKLLDGAISLDFENRYKTKDGRVIHLSWTATPLLEEELMYCIARDITEKKQNEQQIVVYQKRLKDLATEITLAEEKVRKHIAVDLHDHVGQILTSTRMQLARVKDMLDDPEAVVRINNVSQSVLKAVQATREAIFSLSLPQLNELGLVAATHDWMKEEIEAKYGIKTTLEGEEIKFNLDENRRVLLFRSLKELMMNTVKHARANNLKIIYNVNDENIEITVKDDGVGFNYNADLIRLQSKGYGLFSIEERLADLGGAMEVNTSPGSGTTIKLRVPLQ